MQSTHKCIGVTAKNTPCTKPVKTKGSYCYIHRGQSQLPNVWTPKVVDETPINNTGRYNVEECPICLCDMEPLEKLCELACEHRYHTECMKCVLKLECPVCRGPLEFKVLGNDESVYKKVASTIKGNEIKNNKELKKESITNDVNVARELDRQLNNNYNELYYNRGYFSDVDMENAVQQSVLSQEVFDCDHVASILEESYYMFKAIEESLILEEISRISSDEDDVVNYFLDMFKSGGGNFILNLR